MARRARRIANKRLLRIAPQSVQRLKTELRPLLLHPRWIVLPIYVAASFVQGTVLSVVFHLAHCVVEADFPLPHTANLSLVERLPPSACPWSSAYGVAEAGPPHEVVVDVSVK
jgi:hypothetical protein